MGAEKILVIEDDVGTAEAVLAKLNSAGFTCIVKHTQAEGLEAFREQEPDLVVLDLILPDGDGLDACRTLRQESQIPIVLLTARGEEADRIIGLESGADDYVTKPFSPKELISRIRAVLRRSTQQPADAQQHIYRAAGISLDESRHEISVDGQLVKFTPTEYRILAILLRSAGQVVSRDVLTKMIWGYEGFSSNLLEIHVGNIRRKIEANPRKPRRLITVRSFGYKLADAL